MRRLASLLTILAASAVLTGSTLMAAERMENAAPDNGKDVCLLTAFNCANEVDSIQMRIDRLNKEISKGTDVYTRDELNVLKNELEDTIKNLESIVSGG